MDSAKKNVLCFFQKVCITHYKRVRRAFFFFFSILQTKPAEHIDKLRNSIVLQRENRRKQNELQFF